MNLSNIQLFQGLKEDEITSLLSCLNAERRSYKKGRLYFRKEVLQKMSELCCLVWLWYLAVIFGEITVFWETQHLALYLLRYMPAFQDSQCWLQYLLWKRHLYSLWMWDAFWSYVPMPAPFMQSLHETYWQSVPTKICSFLSEFSIQVLSPYEDDWCLIFQSVSNALEAILFWFHTTASSWQITWMLTAALCAASFQKCRRMVLFNMKKIMFYLKNDRFLGRW